MVLVDKNGCFVYLIFGSVFSAIGLRTFFFHSMREKNTYAYYKKVSNLFCYFIL